MRDAAKGSGALAMALAVAWCALARAEGAETSDWPCIQHKVPEISAGMMWSGPAIDERDRGWQESPEVAPLAYRLAQRRLPLEEAQKEIDAFAEATTEDPTPRLVMLFTALLQIVNSERSEIMAGIERYARKQALLADEIQALNEDLIQLRAAGPQSDGDRVQLEELEQRLAWETRIFSEREQSLTYVCESPVLLEQRLFALARQIMAHLK